jgi:hypothetical protein
MFHFHSAPYFTSSLTLYFPCSPRQLFLTTIYLICSIVSMLLISLFPHNTLSHSIRSAVCIHTFSAMFHCHSTLSIKFSLTRHIPSPSSKLFFIPHFNCYVPLSQYCFQHFFPHMTHSISIQSIVFLNHNLTAMFYCNIAPYFKSSLTLHFPSPSLQLFLNHNFFALSLVTVFFVSLLPSHYTLILNPVSCL